MFFHIIILEILLIKPRVNIYLSWTVYKVPLGEMPPIINHWEVFNFRS